MPRSTQRSTAGACRGARSGTVLAAIAAAAALAGCAHAPRDEALGLSHAGVQAASGVTADVDARVSRLRASRAAQDFVAAYGVMSRCASITHGTGADPNCDAAAFARSRAAGAVSTSIAALADVVAKRAAAARALGSAYAALGDEAAYDAPADIDNAIAPAFAAVNRFGSAVGLPPIAALAGTGARFLGRALADDAQRRRILRDSREIARVTHHLRSGIERERARFADLDALLAELDAETRGTMLKAGLLDPAATVSSVAAAAGVPVAEVRLPAALAADPALRGAAEVAMLGSLPPVSSGDLDAAIAALADLEAQHDRLERNRPLDLAQVAADLGTLADAVEAARP